MQTVKNLTQFLIWVFLIAISIYFFLDNVWAFVYGYRSQNFGNSFFNNQFWVVCHLVGGSLALFLGPIQFWKKLRTKYPGFHRIAGKVYIAGALLTGLSALRLSLVSQCGPCRLSLFLLAVLALGATSFAWIAIKNRNIKAHRQFMVRSYVLLFSFVAVRIDQIFSMDFLFTSIQDRQLNRVVNEYFFSFFPLIVAEICMTWLPALGLRTWAAQKKSKRFTDSIQEKGS